MKQTNYQRRVAALRKLAPPDASKHTPDPAYAKALLNAIPMTRSAVAAKLDLSPSSLRAMGNGQTPLSYTAQYGLEALVATSKQEKSDATE